MKFVDRTREIKRMEKSLGATHPQLVVVYGRRRVEKSTNATVLLPDDIIRMAR